MGILALVAFVGSRLFVGRPFVVEKDVRQEVNEQKDFTQTQLIVIRNNDSGSSKNSELGSFSDERCSD